MVLKSLSIMSAILRQESNNFGGLAPVVNTTSYLVGVVVN